MPKAPRLHAPGCVVHITARTQGGQPWFSDPIKTRVVAEITAAGQSSGHRVLAYTVMPNHFHVVVRQGPAPLSAMMHRVMHRSAILLRVAHGLDGHVFQRRYWSGVCATVDHVRTTITYVHLNAWRAGLCQDPQHYPWSSHGQYLEHCDHPGSRTTYDERGLRFFQANDDPATALPNYLASVDYQISIDRFRAGELPADRLEAPQPCAAGDAHWLANYAAAVQACAPPSGKRPLFDVAAALLARTEPRCPLDLVRSGTRNRQIATIRRNLIAALLTHGYRGIAVARFFGVSQTLVSQVAVSLRS